MGKQIPKHIDFSKKAVSKAVLSQTIQHPLVLYPVGALAVGTMATAFFGLSMLSGLAMAGGSLLAILSWLVNQFGRRDSFANHYIRSMRKRLLEQHEAVLSEIDRGLEAVKCQQGREQLTRLQQKFESFKEILGSKLNESELTYGRYLGIAEQVYLASIDNLQCIATVTKSIDAIDDSYVKKRISELSNNQDKNHSMQLELESLVQRNDLFKQQSETINIWFSQNEQAMTRLDHASAEIAQMKTIQGHSNMKLESAMTELQRLADQASDYSIP